MKIKIHEININEIKYIKFISRKLTLNEINVL